MALGLDALAIAVLASMWLNGAAMEHIATWSAVALVYFLFFAPTNCLGLASNGSVCRKEKRGLVRSCDTPSHRWENLLHFVTPAADVPEFVGRVWKTVRLPSTCIAAIGTALALVSVLFAQIALAV
jgi:hypothetical protein